MFFVCLFVFWFGFFPPVEMMRGNRPRLVSVCHQAYYPQLAVVEGGESLSYSKRVQVETQERQPWRVEEQRVVGKGMWGSVLCLLMMASVTFASQLISISSTEKKYIYGFDWTSRPVQPRGVMSVDTQTTGSWTFFSLGGLALVKPCTLDPVFCICKTEIRILPSVACYGN